MTTAFEYFFSNLNRPKTYLILANILLVFFAILLSNLGVLPIKNLSDFLFFTLLFLLFSLYRPGWSFLFFVGTITLENINIAPGSLGIAVRPYQFFAGLTILAVLGRLVVGRLGFKLPRFSWYDIAPAVFAMSGFISVLGATDKNAGLKHSIVALSFVAIYFLARVFIQNIGDLKRIIPFFLSSGIVVIFYGIWQNIRFMKGLESFETMPGRPNATFAEPDWLGICLVLLLTVIYSLIYFFNNLQLTTYNLQQKRIYLSNCWLLVVGCLVLLILTVSRGAWLGVAAITIVFLLFALTKLSVKIREWQWRQFFQQFLFIAVAMIGSIGIVYIFNLTNFQIFNRIQSTGTGLQKITVSCEKDITLPEAIGNISALEQYNCRHINLEDIEKEKSAGNVIKEIYRTDPNVNIRGEIYRKSWQEIKKHPIFGIGWGNIGAVLGSDERRIALNSSNIFLEVWLGAGILGLLAIILIWVYILVRGIKYFSKDDLGEKTLGLFLFSGGLALITVNLFNAGIFLGILWLFFSISRINK
ncbi:MAG: O-antigen ligase family protein [Candidatus Moranbacteria bacterium]|nr:O-antigen ligase family protein [Candidatus Moranbacteria bacterium]